MGEAMKATKGQGNPQLLNRLLDEPASEVTDTSPRLSLCDDSR